MQTAYGLAEAGFDHRAAVNRIILATDGDFNVGITDRDQLRLHRAQAQERRVPVGPRRRQGNYNDA